MKIPEMIAVPQAMKEDKAQWKHCFDKKWSLFTESCLGYFNRAGYEFRVKPEPREFWIHKGAPDTVWHPQILEYEPINPEFIHVREVIE